MAKQVNNDSKLNTRDFFSVLWNYFSFHANQRIQVSNFYIVIECFLMGGFFTVSQLPHNQFIYKIIICCSIIFISIVFFMLDYRTKIIIKIVEDSIIQIERQYTEQLGKEIMVFSKEKENTESFRTKFILWQLISYSKIFSLLFLFFTVISILGIIAVLLEYL
jgi:hypothetical protein